jgi:hypothetical protein
VFIEMPAGGLSAMAVAPLGADPERRRQAGVPGRERVGGRGGRDTEGPGEDRGTGHVDGFGERDHDDAGSAASALPGSTATAAARPVDALAAAPEVPPAPPDAGEALPFAK